MGKYLYLISLSAKSRLTYMAEIFASAFFLLIIHFVFIQLWTLSFQNGEGKMQGFSLAMMLWYFVGTETLIHAMPPIHRWYERDVRDGEIAVRLNKPISYLGFQWCQFFGEYLIRATMSMIVGGLLIYGLVGGINVSLESIPLILLSYLLAVIMNFCWSTLIGLSAFWTEDVSGAFFVFDRLKWLLGGFLLPITFFPDFLKSLTSYLPFQYMIYAPAKLMVKFEWSTVFNILLYQVLWALPLLGSVILVYRIGVKRVSVNGG